MSFDSVKNTVLDNLNPVDFAHGFVDSAVHQPLRAIDQLQGHKIEKDSDKSESLATKAGDMAGFILDFTLAAKCSGAMIKPLLGEAAETAAGAATKMFVAGGFYGGVLTPSATDRSLLTGRLQDGLVSASTFAVTGGLGKALETSGSVIEGKGLLPTTINNALSGAAGGVVESYGSTYFSQHRAATFAEVVSSAGQYAALGAGFGALDFGLNAAGQKLARVPAVENTYWRARSAYQDGVPEGRRMTYATLNKYDMAHPLQRLGDLLYGSEIVDTKERPLLTTSNNPVTKLTEELPAYFNEIQRLDEIPERGAAGYDAYKQMQAKNADFAFELLKLWHGTAEQPGIKSFTDHELATADVPAEKVAQIRKALISSTRPEYPAASPFMNALAELVGESDLSSNNRYEIDRTGGLSRAREKFYKYDEDELRRRMSMPSDVYSYKRSYGTPSDWLPFSSTEKLPNFFHGTMSSSLDSLFSEKTLYSSKEMRLRGIEQKTGESSQEEFPRRAVSLTTDFNEAWAYHRHSPAYLTDFPVVLGISSEITSRTKPAGLLEPGETLIDKVRVGQSLMTKMGLRGQEMTHIFVPDSEVAQVVRQISRYRIQGLQVLGLSELQQPQWSPLPAGAEDNWRH